MQSENFRAMIKPITTVNRLIWIAFVAAVPFYVCVAYLTIDRSASGAMPGPPLSFKIYIVALSLLAAVLAPYVPRRLLRYSRLRQLLDREPDPSSTISPDEQRLLALVRYLFVGFIIRLAFNESIALYGLVLAFTTKSFAAALPFAVVSFVLVWKVPLPLDEALKRTASIGVEQGVIPTRPR